MASSTASPTVSLWLKAEPFVNGILPIPPHPRLSVHYIKKLVTYAKAKGKLGPVVGAPQMSYSIWKHVACNKLLLSEDLAWMYYMLCDLVVCDDAENRLDWWKTLHNAESDAQRTELRLNKTVDLYKFALLLYIQQLNKISLRSSLISGGDEWPTRSRSPSPDSNGGIVSAQASKHMDEHAHLTFILTNLLDMLELLVEPDSYSVGLGDPSLTAEAVEALSLLFSGSVDDKRNCKSLHQLLSQQQIQTKAGYSKITNTYSLRQFSSWVKSCLGQNPFGVTSCISKGRRLSWLTAEERASGAKRGKLATNAHLVTRETSKGNKLIIMSQVCKETLAKMSSTLEDATVKIHRCHDSFIYLLSLLRTVSVEKCRNTTIVLGPVQCAVHMSHCDDVTLITVCHTLSISYCHGCTIHLSSPNRPLVFSGNENLTLAPFNTSYRQLESQLRQARLVMEPNLWDQPFSLGPDHHSDSAPVWRLMDPAEFYIFTIPFTIQVADAGDSLQSDDVPSGIPSGLPPRFSKSLRQRERLVDQWQKTVKASGLSKEQKKRFQELVESRFQAWLVESGCKTELDGLAMLAKKDKKKS